MRRALCTVALFMMLASLASASETTFRLYRGVTLYVNNEKGKAFDVDLELRDINVYADGPREVLFKIYDPDGKPVVREFIPDDGLMSPNFPNRSGGWDHELMYFANIYAKGTTPTVRFSAWSDPNRLKTLVPRVFKRSIKGGKKGIYRIVLAGVPDHYVTVKISPDLPFGISGHTTFIHGHGNLLKKSFIYVPKGTSGIFMAIIEPDMPCKRVFTLKDHTGKILFKGSAKGGYRQVGSGAIYPTDETAADWKKTMAEFKAGKYDGKVLEMAVSEAPGDYLLKITLQQPKKGAFRDYVGMGSHAVFTSDIKTAKAIQGGTTVVDGEVFWHPFQVRFHEWLKKNPLNANDKEKALRAELKKLFNYFRLFETSDGRGSSSWTNWGYAFGYYGCKVWQPAWALLRRKDIPDEIRKIIVEGLIMGGDRLSIATGMERVNGNAFSQINIALWYCHLATGDKLQKERFELFWDRWSHGEGWGRGSGLSRSGDSQEHFAHDSHYGSYLMDNWRGITWVHPGILEDAKGIDDRFEKILKRYRELYSYLYCREQGGRAVPANPWSARTHAAPSGGASNWEPFGHKWKGEPGADFTVSVNDGDEWFAARRKNYYMLTFHGRLAPEWMSRSFEGQIGFGGGTICQLTIPGKGPVLAGTLHESYGKGMHPSNWRNFHIHSIVGETWDGRPLISAISDHEDYASLEGTTVSSAGEVWDTNIRVSRSYTYKPDRISCSVALAESDYAKALSIWSHGRKWSEVKLAYEMIPFRAKFGKLVTTVTLKDDAGKNLGAATTTFAQAKVIRIDRGGFGVEIQLPKPMPVALGANNTVLIEITSREVKAEAVKLSYDLVPYGN